MIVKTTHNLLLVFLVLLFPFCVFSNKNTTSEYSFSKTNLTKGNADSFLLFLSENNPSCESCTDGNISVSVVGGVFPYTYIWSTGATTSSIQNLPNGMYIVTVTDLLGTQELGSVMLQGVGSLAFGVEVLTLGTTCYGENNGNAVAQVTDGTMPYSYLWSTGDTVSTSSNLTQGGYSLTVTDAEGLTTVAEFEITQPDSLATETIAIMGCDGGNSGSVQAMTTGGAFPYSYLWSTGDTITTVEGLSTGTYGITVTDFNGCSSQSAVFLTQPIALNTSLLPSSTSCSGMANGSITANVWGGFAPYTYLWSTEDTTSSLSGLAEGFYELVVTDANGCAVTSQVTVEGPAPINLNVQGISNVTCHGGSDGAIFANAFGGTPEYTYAWSNGDIGTFIDSLSAGSYIATITDATGCTGTGSVNVLEAQPLQTFLFGSSVCNGVDDGTAEVVVSGGTLPYTYVWNTGATTAVLENLAPATYYVTVTDINQCTTTDSLLVNLSNVILNANVSSSAVTCPLGNNGTASVSPTGGVAPYTYQWSNEMTDSVISNLTSGTYTVIIQDLFNCSIERTIEITEPAPLMANAVIQNLNCESTGSIFLNPSGGEAPYTYQWANGSTSDSLTGLDQGAYAVNITDANSCVKQFFIDVVVNNNPPVALTTNFSISLNESGIAIISTELINDGSFDDCGIDTMYLDITQFDCNSIGENTVTLTVVDEENEMSSETATITITDQVAPVASGQEVILYLDENGSTNIATNQINNGSTDNCGIDTMYLSTTEFNCDFLGENEIVLSVEDGSGNVGMDTITVTVLDTIAPTISCGTGDLTYTICEEAIVLADYPLPTVLDNCTVGVPTLVSGLAIGDTLVVGASTVIYEYIDAAGNTTTCSFDVNVFLSTPLEIVVDSTTSATPGNNDGSISITVSSGISAFEYEWSLVGGGIISTDEDPTGLASGEYEVVITDAFGCQKSFLIELLTGVNDPELAKKIEIYPNPTSSVLFVKMEVPVTNGDKIRVFSLDGKQLEGGLEKTLKTGEQLVELNLSNFPHGVYVVQLIVNQGVVTKRIVVGK